MKILALEPYYGGSHQAFLDGWIEQSVHDWTVLSLPPYKWKWRMRHSAIHFAQEVATLHEKGERWDLLFCSDMLNLAELKGLLPPTVRDLPSIVYFHENQLTYPVQHEDERDYQFAMTNLTTALAADSVWFNSQFHLESLMEAFEKFLRKMPDFQPVASVGEIRQKARVHPPAVSSFPSRGERPSGPLRILWASRWEHDKNPEDFFAALRQLRSAGVNFRLSVLGESFRNSPSVFEEARIEFADHIDQWGFQETPEAYRTALLETDVLVSTANHEFFGIAAVEAVLAGNYPLLPRRLAYPELLDLDSRSKASDFFYDGTIESLVNGLKELSRKVQDRIEWNTSIACAIESASRFEWSRLAPIMDRSLSSS